jgi:hypothetical protein
MGSKEPKQNAFSREFPENPPDGPLELDYLPCDRVAIQSKSAYDPEPEL